MRHKPTPDPEPAPIDARRVRYLLARIATEHNAGNRRGEEKALRLLGDICGVMTYYQFALIPDDKKITDEEMHDMATGLLARSR